MKRLRTFCAVKTTPLIYLLSATLEIVLGQYCPWPESTINGEFALAWWVTAPSFAPKSTIHLSCPHGLQPVNKVPMVCQNNGEWQGTWQGCRTAKTEEHCSSCQPPKAPANGRIQRPSISPDQYSAGDTVDFSCNGGYYMTGSPRIYCLDNGRWSDEEPKCVNGLPSFNDQTFCPQQLFSAANFNSTVLPLFAKYAANTFVVGAKIYFSCLHGREIQGQRRIECLSSGDWSAEPPNCVEPFTTRCPEPPPAPKNAQLVMSLSHLRRLHQPGGHIHYKCNSGFVAVGHERLHCTANGTWSNPTPLLTCDPITTTTPTTTTRRPYCPSIEKQLKEAELQANFTQARWSSPNNPVAEEESFYTLSCKAGHTLVGDSSLACTRGKWVGSIPKCVLNPRCPGIANPIPANSPLEMKLIAAESPLPKHPHSESGSRMVFTCKPGYELVGNSLMVCVHGAWVGAIPQCVLKPRCPSMMHLVANDSQLVSKLSLADGPMPTNPLAETGSRITFECKPGYRLVGDTSLVCAAGRWIGTVPKCELLPRCLNVSHQFHAHQNLHVHYLHAQGPMPHHHQIEPGSKMHFTCADGYSLVGDSHMICVGNGSWAGSVPQCVLKPRCPPMMQQVANDPHMVAKLSLAEGPLPKHPHAEIGSRVTFECKHGFQLVGGDSSVVCVDGKWLGTVPKCVQKPRCPSVMDQMPKDASHPLIAKFDFKDTAQNAKDVDSASKISFECRPGHSLIGDTHMVCVNGTWFGKVPQCEVKPRCPSPMNQITPNTHLVAKLSQADGPLPKHPHLEVGSRISFSCHDGFDLVGDNQMVCAGKNWVGSIPTCMAKPRCHMPTELMHDAAHHHTHLVAKFVAAQSSKPSKDLHMVDAGSRFEFSCKSDYDIRGDSFMLCVNGSWIGKQPTCVHKPIMPNLCMFAQPPGKHLKLEEFDYYPESGTSHAGYNCGKGYAAANGSSLDIHCKLNQWEKLPTCEKRQQKCIVRVEHDKKRHLMDDEAWDCLSSLNAMFETGKKIQDHLHGHVDEIITRKKVVHHGHH